MRFRFCGDGDCPDWVLAEINTLSRLSSVKLKLLGQAIVEGLINPPLNLPKAEKMFADSKLDADDLKSSIACLRYIIFSTVRYNCDHSALCSELQQLGLPREHSLSIKKVCDDHSAKLTTKLENTSLKVNELENAVCKADPETKCSTLEVTVNGQTESVLLSPVTVDVLVDNLKLARIKMVELVNSPYNYT